MFPEQFAQDWIGQCSAPGELVFDPFSGRGTTPFQALLMDRGALANDANPVAFVLTGAKVHPPKLRSVIRRIDQLENGFEEESTSAHRKAMPKFFGRAFHHRTLDEVIYLRSSLDWRNSSVDRFIAALCLGSLHGEMDKSHSYFSNQMPRTISTKPAYSLKFWRERDLWPKRRHVFALLRDRAEFRFATPPPSATGSAYLSDVRAIRTRASRFDGEVALVVTSPPYLDVTNFEEDQWLRLWFLGGPPRPSRGLHSRDDRHERPDGYWQFICDSWRAIRPLLAARSYFVCRIGSRRISSENMRKTVSASMRFLASRSKLEHFSVGEIGRRQTDAFRPGTVGCRFEADFVFALRQ